MNGGKKVFLPATLAKSLRTAEHVHFIPGHLIGFMQHSVELWVISRDLGCRSPEAFVGMESLGTRDVLQICVVAWGSAGGKLNACATHTIRVFAARGPFQRRGSKKAHKIAVDSSQPCRFIGVGHH